MRLLFQMELFDELDELFYNIHCNNFENIFPSRKMAKENMKINNLQFSFYKKKTNHEFDIDDCQSVIYSIKNIGNNNIELNIKHIESICGFASYNSPLTKTFIVFDKLFIEPNKEMSICGGLIIPSIYISIDSDSETNLEITYLIFNEYWQNIFRSLKFSFEYNNKTLFYDSQCLCLYYKALIDDNEYKLKPYSNNFILK